MNRIIVDKESNISTIKEALKLENIKIVNALIIPLEYVLGKNKRVKWRS